MSYESPNRTPAAPQRRPAAVRITRGVYVPDASGKRLADRVRILRTILPVDAVITGTTALHLYGVAVGRAEPVHAVTSTRTQTKRSEVRLGRVQVLPPSRRGMAEPAYAWLAACADLNLLEAVTAADWLLRRRLVTLEELWAAASGATGRGCRLARRAAGLARERVDSPQETKLRLCLTLAGLPEPRCNVPLGNDSGLIGRGDLLLEAYKTILEYEGDHHRTDRQQWNVDVHRVEAFTDEGYLVIRVTGARMRRPRAVVLRVYAKIAERGYAGPAPTFSAEWSALFEPPTHRV